MQTKTTLLALAMSLAVLAGCAKQDDAAPVDAAPAPVADDDTAVDAVGGSASGATEAPAAAPEPAAEAPAAPAAPVAAEAATFDLEAIPLSSATLPDWPYLALPAGYGFDDADRLERNTKDLARIPVWTGGQLVWVEGKVFSDEIESVDGKTYSKFELAKGVRQQIESLGGVRVAERSYGKETYQANRKALEDFRHEFSDIRGAYWYEEDAETYVIRRDGSVVWIVVQARNSDAAVMVAEGPAPDPAAG